MPMFTPEKALLSIRKTPLILAAVLHPVSPEDARQRTDGPEGWNMLEVVGHLRDYEEIFCDRAHRILSEENPTLPAYNPEELVKSRAYSDQSLPDILGRYQDLRHEFIHILSNLTDEQWARRGVHPQSGSISMMELALNAALHDVNHIEQIVKILAS